MSKICYLHLGLHKTASTSFQKTCVNNMDLLQVAGITYPLFSCTAANKSKIFIHNAPIASLFKGDPTKHKANIRWGIVNDIEEVNSAYEMQLEGFLRTSQHILISGEGISFLGVPALSAFIDKIHSYDYEIKATALIRSPYSAVCSGMQESIKNGRYIKLISLNNSVPKSFNARRYKKSKIVEKLKSVLGKSITFHSFENACTHSYGPVGFLLEEFLSQDPSVFKYEKANESLSNLFIRMQNELNAINPRFVDRKINPNFQKLSNNVDERLKFSGKFLLTEAEYESINKLIKRQVESLSEITGLDFSEQLLKFSKPIY
jgi:hypothetical protein